MARSQSGIGRTSWAGSPIWSVEGLFTLVWATALFGKKRGSVWLTGRWLVGEGTRTWDQVLERGTISFLDLWKWGFGMVW